MADDFQAVLDALPAPPPPTHQQMLDALGVALTDALGPHGEQPDLASRWQRERDRGRRLQVSGFIHLPTLERQVAERMLGILARYAEVELPPIPGESFDDL